MNLADMSVEQLQNLQNQITREINTRRMQNKKEVLAKIKAMAAAGGYSLEELIAGGIALEPAKAKRAVPPKYRHLSKHDLTWTGRGKRPRWVAEFLAAGNDLSDLLIR
jgi:DNA-binding protein H-NS